MLVALFTWLTNSLNASAWLALSASFLWGLLSIILSPCHLASIPLIIGFIDEQGRISTKRAFLLSLLFALGILVTIALVGVVTGLMGRMMGDLGKWGNYLVAVVFIIVGLHFLGIIPLPFAGQAGQPVFRKKGLWAALILGLVFGLALGPCTFAYMAPMLGIAFNLAAGQLLLAIGLVFAYALGHISVIVLAGTFTEVVQKYLDWNEKSQGTIIVKKICGALMLLGGIYLIYTAVG
jgi:cytochrome c-type biogenesis protein